MQPANDKLREPKLFKFNYSSGLHPLFLVILIFISGNLIFVSISRKPAFRVNTPQFQLASSNTFKKLIECNDKLDGVQCFRDFRNELIGESRSGMSSISNTQLETCLDIVSSNANDLALMVNIQTCYHQADILDRAVEFNASSSGSSWFVITGVLISLFIQVFIAIHSIVTFIFRNRDLEHYGTNIRHLADNFEILNEKQLEIYNTVSSLIGTIKSETRNLQGRLNRGGDVRREIEYVSENVDSIMNDFNHLKGYIYSSCGPTAAILPPPSLKSSNIYKKVPQANESYNTKCKSMSEFYNNDKYEKNDRSSNFFKPNSTKENRSRTSNITSLPDILNSEPMPSIPGHQAANNQNEDMKSSFDISTTEGRVKWKEYIKDQLVKSKESKPPVGNYISVLKSINTNQISSENTQGSIDVRYQDIVKSDQNNKRFRRIFILGRGWVSLKKLEEEEQRYGSASLVKLETQVV